MPKTDFVILFSAGLAKTIIYDLCNEGYQVLDIGRGLESYYKGVSIEYRIHILERTKHLEKLKKWNQKQTR